MMISEAVKGRVAERLKRRFPSAPYTNQALLDEFINRNNLVEPISRVDMTVGSMAYWDNYSHIILYHRIDRKGDLEPTFGGNDLSSHHKSIYYLEGILRGEKVILEAECSHTQAYKGSTVEGMLLDMEESGEPRVANTRIDSCPYWFVTEPK